MSHLFPRHMKGNLPIATHGEGAYIFDKSGKSYLDASGGAAVSCLGHSDAEVTEAIRLQSERIAYAHTGFFSTEVAERLASKLARAAPEDLDKVYLVSGGSEAVEAALKLARQYFVERGEPERRHFIARRQSYHGNTLGALATGGNKWRRAQFEPLMTQAHHISPCYAYRGRQAGESLSAYGARVAQELETQIEKLGAQTVIAFVAEPVVGATMGAVPAVPGYFKKVRDICTRHGILLILDEVMCGAGRTGSFFAFEQEAIVPDIVTMAKGLGAGYMPIGAMICRNEIYETIKAGSGFFQHGHTYMGHPLAAAAAGVVVDKLTHGGMTRRAAQMGLVLDDALHDAFGDHPFVGDIRGRGMFRGIELVADRESKRSFPPQMAINKAIKAAAMDAGLICYPMGGTIDGQLGDHVLLAPPFILEPDQIGELVARLSTAFSTVLDGVTLDSLS